MKPAVALRDFVSIAFTAGDGGLLEEAGRAYALPADNT